MDETNLKHYAVECSKHGLRRLSREEYWEQHGLDRVWLCPVCRKPAKWAELADE